MTPGEELAVLGKQKHAPTLLGKKFVFKTLDSMEELLADQTASVFSDKARSLKIEKLARSIETIDGVALVTLDEQEIKGGTSPLAKARKLIYSWEPPVVDAIYSGYEELEKKRHSAISEIEKNAQSPIPSSGAGK